VDALLAGAGIRGYFHDIVSVDEVRSFKPSPAVYHHFLNRSGAVASHAWLISSNPFDVIGAVSSGMCAAWVRRSPEAVFDPWGIDPTITVSTVAELADKLPNE
jgi:2-haloacid dehalogenase